MCESCEKRTCANCGRESQYLLRGRCNSCYKYLIRRGYDRTKTETRNPKRTGPMPCSNCGRTVELNERMIKGRCLACYKYVRTLGKERQPESMTPRLQYPAWCESCGVELTRNVKRIGNKCEKCSRYEKRYGKPRPAVLFPPRGLCRQCRIRSAKYRHSGLCEVCSRYKRKYGKNRPKWLDGHTCRNCGRPTNTWYRRTGLCPTCSKYRSKTGKDRPSHLWGVGIHGWCECGNPASHVVPITVHKHTEDMPLCDGCHAEYMRQVRWYGGNVNRQQPNAGDD